MTLIRASSSGKTSDVEYDASNDGGSNQSFDGLDPQPRYVGQLVKHDANNNGILTSHLIVVSIK